ncbi:metal-dependent transcriptional regulator [Ferruginibacter paludis]|uniref:metal-dependent transcriptional regulator n=1 Tax=Ferruginibacter TaxID=1004303 RepID=UPI0025B42162|nr:MULTISPECIES: metal-dependent transcriptional regulator [Ferruginibacter]MDB5279974.1 Mn-dependent transcriptional regulator MntR [Ferruginibacter sp.]MDN3658725.1 metal-dependent transcriptional regulator [Ferruginibacter paludis]
MNSLIEENYLKALFNMANEAGEVNVTELSRRLEIKMPTVTSMMKKLSDKKLVLYESYKPLRLSEKGKKEAGLIIRKHRLTEMFLVEKMHLGWEDVHDIAEQIEHIQSPVFFEKMDELLGYPKVDPHGSPIPDKSGKIVWKEYNKLSDCREGETAKLAAVINTSSDFLKFLNGREMRLGVKIKIRSIEPFDKSMVVSYGKRQAEVLSNVVCERILVEKEG